jgi:hypothetical protein
MRAETHVGLHVKQPLLLSGLIEVVIYPKNTLLESPVPNVTQIWQFLNHCVHTVSETNVQMAEQT